MRGSSSHPAGLRRQRGVGMVEVLITILVLSIGLLGIAAMQATALRNGQSSLERSQAVIQSYSIIDAMRANRTAAIGNAYDFAIAVPCTPPAGATLADDDMTKWIGSLKVALGTDACGSVVVDNDNNVTVVVQWNDSRGSVDTSDATAALASQTRQLRTMSQL